MDVDYLEENLLDENADDVTLEFSELDIDELGVDCLQDLLELMEDIDELGKDGLASSGDRSGKDNITGSRRKKRGLER